MRICRAICVLALSALAAQSPRADRARSPEAFTQKYRQGIRWMQEREWQRADAAFAEALSYRDSPDARRQSRICRFNLWIEQGEVSLAGGQYEIAVEEYRKALDLDSHSAAATQGLRTAQYQLSFRDGMQFLSRHREQEARQSFERCLEIRPDDPAALRQLLSVRAAGAASLAWRTSWARVEECLQAPGAPCLDRQIPFLAGQAAAMAGIADQAVERTPNAALLPAFLRYAGGDLPGALDAARNAGAPAANRFSSFLRRKLRWRFARKWAGWTAGLYAATLLVSLYFGVRQERTRQIAASGAGA